nr:AraC family transcriptional regulator [Clostridiales bacterium]
MDKKDSKGIYSAVINKAIDYIFENIDNDIDVEDVAKHCGYSKYHLTRMFKEDTEEAIYEFIKRVRLERSAWRLKVEKERSVTEIGGDIGYSSSNYATAFKKQMNISPANFRKNSEELVKQSAFSHGMSLDDIEVNCKNITIENFEPFCVIYERKKGNYHKIGDEWCAFQKKYKHLFKEDSLYIECTVDDPSITDEDECLYELCQTIEPNCQELKD